MANRFPEYQKTSLLQYLAAFIGLVSLLIPLKTYATTFTTTVPGTSITLPTDYPQAGGVAMVYVGVNGNIYYQFSDPAGAFRGFNSNANPRQFQGNPFTINSPLQLDCGFTDCRTYFGGDIANMYIRFSAYDGDTQRNGFDEDDISLVLNGFNIGNWSDIQTELTNNSGTVSQGFTTGFGNNTFNTGWFETTNQALLNDILDSGEVTTQVFDRDPNDNFWDFRRGPRLNNAEIVTVAPGYTIEKTSDRSTFTAVGDVINYEYKVSNIGSVRITNLSVTDDKISNVQCLDTTIIAVPFGTAEPDSAICTGQYTVTQEDFDNEAVTNIANAIGTPEFGVLGNLTDTLTVTGPSISPSIEVRKSTTLTNFSNAGTTIPYNFEVENTGDATLTNVVVTDARIPSLSCSFATLARDAIETCSGTYTVTQADVNDFIINGNQLQNTASVTSLAPNGSTPSDTDVNNLDGPTSQPAFTINKLASNSNFQNVGQVINYQFQVRNTGNVDLPSPPAITDSLGIPVNCPAGAIAVNELRTCTAQYTVTQPDIDAGKIDNTANATITVGGVTALGTSNVSVPAVRNTGLQFVKRLTPGSTSSFDDTGVTLSYDYELRNTGNVTLQNPSVIDDKTTVVCTEASIAPQQQIICTASYDTTQEDLNAGSVTNVATASATPFGETTPLTSTQQSVTVNGQRLPALSLDKVGGTATPAFTVGSTITYTFNITNSGNVDILDPITITDDKIGNFPCLSGPLVRGATDSCTAVYTLTSADISANSVTNIATASDGIVTSPSDSETVANTTPPEITLSKAADISPIPAGTTTVGYTFTVVNSSSTVQIIRSSSPITIDDPKIGAVDCTTNQPTTFNPGDSFTCTGTATLNQAEIDAGEVINTATASFPFTLGGTASTFTTPSAIATTPITENLNYRFDKTGPTNFTTVGETLTYTFEVENLGNVTLTQVNITDPLIPTLSCPITNLAPSATTSCTGDYIVTQTDVDSGQIDNTATATGLTASGGQLDMTSVQTSTRPAQVADTQFTVDKTANLTAFNAVGDVITYAIEVQNTGLQTLTSVSVTDVLDPGFSCMISSIVPGQMDSSCTFTHIVTQADIDAGEIINIASATSGSVGPITSTLTIPGPTRVADFSIEKNASGAYNSALDTIDFTIKVKNTGNVTLSTVDVSDATLFSPAQTCQITNLLPNAEDTTTCVFTYTVQQADVDIGVINNTATATGLGADGTSIPEKSASEQVNGPTENASLNVVKVEDTPTGDYTNLPTTESFTITVENTGNVTITNVVVTDDLIGLNCTIASIDPGVTATSCSSGLMTGTYTVTQADIDNGSFENTATATGSTVRGASPTSTGRVTLTGPAMDPALTVVKSTTFIGTYDTVGQQIDYNYLVTNSGNQTLLSSITISDDQIPLVSCPALTGGTFAPNDTLTCTGSYLVTQEDIDRGSITNIASATNTTNGVTTTSTNATQQVFATQNPVISLDKRLKSTSLGTYNAENDTVIYEYVVTNTGNTTITDDIFIDDNRFPTDLTCTVGGTDLVPNAQIICEQTYTIQQADVNAGSVTNTAQAFTGPNLAAATLTSNTDQVTVTAIQNPALTITKTYIEGLSEDPLDDPAATDLFVENEVLDYDFTITNSGNVSITLDPATVISDNRIGPFICTGAPPLLEPGESHTCSASYTIVSADIALGAVTNIASASGTFGIDTITSPTDDALFPVDAMPAVTIEKLADVTTFNAVNDPIIYTYNITNTGNTDLPSPGTVTDDKFTTTGPLTCNDPSGGVFSRLETTPTEIATCTQTYFVTQEDLDAGFVTNEAFALTSFNGLPVQSPAAIVTVTGDTTATLLLTKTVSPTAPADLNDLLTYTLTASASGNQTISGVEITDPLLSGLTCSQGTTTLTTANLDPNGDPLVCTGTLTVTQEMLDAGEVVNTGNARGSAPDGSNVTTSAENRLTTITALPSLSIIKRIDPVPTAVGDPSYSAVDQDVTFVIDVQNTGNVTIENVNVTDSIIAGTCSIGTLAPGATDSSCIFVKSITQEDIDAGSFVNEATVDGDPAIGNLTPMTGNVTVFGPEREPSFAITKNADVNDFDEQGDLITYTYLVANTGNITLFDQPVIVDDKIGTFDCGTIPATGLAPLDSVTCTQTYSVTQSDVDAGFVTNIASVTSTEVTEAATATETVNSTRTPSLSFTKVATISSGATTAAVGDTITYTYTVTNTGNVTLTNVDVEDDQTSASGTAALTVSDDTLLTDNGLLNDSSDPSGSNSIWDNLAPLDVVTFTSIYIVQQADIDLGNDLSNTATVSGAGPPGTISSQQQITVDVPVEAADPTLEAIKTISNSTGNAAGDTITFEITIENKGNVTLDNVILTDTISRTDTTPLTLTSGPTLQSGNNGVAGDLEVGETWIYQATYILTQEDIDAGGISNTVLVESTAPDGSPVNDISGDGTLAGADNPTLFTIPSNPSIFGEKSITSSTVTVGETVDFEITITNNGNVTLTDVDVSSDSLTRSDTVQTQLALTTQPSFVSSTNGSPSGTLLPNEAATYIASYILVQEDIDAGGISNTAVVTGTPPIGSPITDITDNDSTSGGPDDQTELTIPENPLLELEKRLAVGQNPNFSTLDEIIEYEFIVTNAGNITLPGPFTISDAKIEAQGGALTCLPVASPGLAPDATLTCTGSYQITQDDLDAGQFENSATVNDGISPTSDPSTFTIPAVQTPSMELEKTAEDIPAADFIEGKEVTYTYTATNTGNITLIDPIIITDNLIPDSDFTCPTFPTEGIAPQQSYVCTATYTVTSNDVFLTSVTNIASATSGTTTSPQTSETIPRAGVANLSIQKTVAPGTTFSEVGDTIDYTFTVTNSGTQAFATDVIIKDDRLSADLICFDFVAGSSGTFNAGATATCSGSYTVTQDDLDAGEIFNEAFSQTEFSDGATPPNLTTVVSDPSNVTTPASIAAALTIVKTATPDPITIVGETVTYSIVVTNTGNQTLNTISVSDPLLPTLVCEAATLLRGDTLTCSDTYVVQQADIDAGSLVNEATVTAQTPNGTPITESTEITTAVPAANPGVEIIKTASPTTLGPVGSLVTYRFAVRNSGNTTLSDLTVTDILDASYECSIMSIAPANIDNTCFYELTVTQDMIDAGSLENTATVNGQDAFGTLVNNDNSIETFGPTRTPSLEATKTSTIVGTAVGQIVDYQLTVENTGNVTLDITNVTDTMTRLNGRSTSLDAPFILISGDDGDGRLDVDETWVYEAAHTITQADVNAGGFNNTVNVIADSPDGTIVSDTSDNGDDTDGNTIDDATVVEITRFPSMEVEKTISQTGAVAGDEVKFIISAINTGNVDITVDNLPIDTLTRADGTSLTTTVPIRLTSTSDDGDNILETTEQLRWEVSYTLTQDDINAGGISNTATLSGLGPDGTTPVSDVSDNGNDSDGNITDDATDLNIAPNPSIEILKAATTEGAAIGENIVYSLTVINRGNVTLSDITLLDTLTRADGTALTITDPTFVSTSPSGASEGIIQPDDTATYSAQYTLVQEDIDAGGVSNTATVSATTPLSATLSDVSDDPNDTANSGPSDPTITSIVQNPVLTLSKATLSTRALFPTIQEAVFEVTVQNDGNTTQTGIQISDDLAAFAAPATVLTANVTATGFTSGSANTGYTGTGANELLLGNATLRPGDRGIIQITTTYSTDGSGFPSPGLNTVTGSSDQLTLITPAVTTVSSADTDNDGTLDSLEGCGPSDDRDNDGICDAEDFDPTGYFYCQEDGRILTGGIITVTGGGFTQTGTGTNGPIRILQSGINGFYQFDVTAPGTYTLSYSDPTEGVASTSRLPITAATPVSTLVDVIAGTTTTNPRILGSSEAGASGNLADFTIAGNPRWYTTFTIAAGDPNVFSNNIPYQACTTPSNLTATKAVVGRSDVRIGDYVNYRLDFDLGASGGAIANATLVDLLPAGIVYLPNSAMISLNGATPVQTEPTITGRRLEWVGQNIPTSSTLTVTLTTRVAPNAPLGKLTNQTFAASSTGTLLSNIAIAVVERIPEHVFDCSDVIGKVFDDKNHNGYHDQGEPGLPSVRVVTVKGTRITTDEYGRFHVPCAELPEDIGTNFIMKLDTHSLPTGYRVTTENPRVVRLTAGKFAKLNFGAAISNVIRIDLNAKAFDDVTILNTKFKAALKNMINQMKDKPSVIRLTYVLNDGASQKQAQQRLLSVQKFIKLEWQKHGEYKLNIERTIKKPVEK